MIRYQSVPPATIVITPPIKHKSSFSDSGSVSYLGVPLTAVDLLPISKVKRYGLLALTSFKESDVSKISCDGTVRLCLIFRSFDEI